MKALEKWLRQASNCAQMETCRKDDIAISCHLDVWINKKSLGYNPGSLGSYAGFVGPSYHKAHTKILYVAVNPSGFSSPKWGHQRERLSKYRDGEPASSIFRWETQVIWATKRNAKWRALFKGPDLRSWDDLAFTNTCLCPTMNDRPPSVRVIERCVNMNLIPLVKIINPNQVIFLSMSNQEHIFNSARDQLDKAALQHATAPHPARRGQGQTAENLRKTIRELFR